MNSTVYTYNVCSSCFFVCTYRDLESFIQWYMNKSALKPKRKHLNFQGKYWTQLFNDLHAMLFHHYCIHIAIDSSHEFEHHHCLYELCNYLLAGGSASQSSGACSSSRIRHRANRCEEFFKSFVVAWNCCRVQGWGCDSLKSKCTEVNDTRVPACGFSDFLVCSLKHHCFAIFVVIAFSGRVRGWIDKIVEVSVKFEV